MTLKPCRTWPILFPQYRKSPIVVELEAKSQYRQFARLVRVLIAILSFLAVTTGGVQAQEMPVDVNMNIQCGQQPSSHAKSTVKLWLDDKQWQGNLMYVAGPGTHRLKIIPQQSNWIVREVKFLDLYGSGINNWQTFRPQLDPKTQEWNVVLYFHQGQGAGASRIQVFVDSCVGQSQGPKVNIKVSATSGNYVPGGSAILEGRVYSRSFYLFQIGVKADIEIKGGARGEHVYYTTTNGNGYFSQKVNFSDSRLDDFSYDVIAKPASDIYQENWTTLNLPVRAESLVVRVSTDKGSYTEGELIRISGDVKAPDGAPVEAQVDLLLGEGHVWARVMSDRYGKFSADRTGSRWYGLHQLEAQASRVGYLRGNAISYFNLSAKNLSCVEGELEAIHVDGIDAIAAMRDRPLFSSDRRSWVSHIKLGSKYPAGMSVSSSKTGPLLFALRMAGEKIGVLGVAEDTTLQIDRFCRDSSGQVHLIGKLGNPAKEVRVDFHHSNVMPDVQIMTPAADIKNVKTRYKLIVDSQKATTVAALDGVVQVRDAQEKSSVELGAGQQVTVPFGGTVSQSNVTAISAPSDSKLEEAIATAKPTQDNSSFGPLQHGYDTTGNPAYRDIDLPEPRVELCQAECSADPKCRAFTYVRPGTYNSPVARCWLKDKPGTLIPHANAVTGIKSDPSATASAAGVGPGGATPASNTPGSTGSGTGVGVPTSTETSPSSTTSGGSSASQGRQHISTSYVTPTLPITREECARRAKLAFQAEGFSGKDLASFRTFGYKIQSGIDHAAYIMCDEAPGGNTLVNIVVASSPAYDGGIPGLEREKLQRHMYNPTAVRVDSKPPRTTAATAPPSTTPPGTSPLITPVAGSAGSGALSGTWKFSSTCGDKRMDGEVQINQTADGKFSGMFKGPWPDAHGGQGASIVDGVQDGDKVRFAFNPTGWTSAFIAEGRVISDGSVSRIEGTLTYGSFICNFTMALPGTSGGGGQSATATTSTNAGLPPNPQCSLNLLAGEWEWTLYDCKDERWPDGNLAGSGEMQINQAADGTFSGTLTGKWRGKEAATINEWRIIEGGTIKGVQQRCRATYLFSPNGSKSYEGTAAVFETLAHGNVLVDPVRRRDCGFNWNRPKSNTKVRVKTPTTSPATVEAIPEDRKPVSSGTTQPRVATTPKPTVEAIPEDTRTTTNRTTPLTSVPTRKPVIEELPEDRVRTGERTTKPPVIEALPEDKPVNNATANRAAPSDGRSRPVRNDDPIVGGRATEPRLMPLKLFWSAARGDNFTTATPEGEAAARVAGYTFVRIEGYVYLTQQPGTLPLKLYYSNARGDNYTTGAAQGEQTAQGSGYGFTRVEGYIYPTQRPGTVPLKNYWNGTREDNFTTATADGERAALGNGYKFASVEGYVIPSGNSPVASGGEARPTRSVDPTEEPAEEKAASAQVEQQPPATRPTSAGEGRNNPPPVQARNVLPTAINFCHWGDCRWPFTMNKVKEDSTSGDSVCGDYTYTAAHNGVSGKARVCFTGAEDFVADKVDQSPADKLLCSNTYTGKRRGNVAEGQYSVNSAGCWIGGPFKAQW